jgi:hypothetical protein
MENEPKKLTEKLVGHGGTHPSVDIHSYREKHPRLKNEIKKVKRVKNGINVTMDDGRVLYMTDTSMKVIVDKGVRVGGTYYLSNRLFNKMLSHKAKPTDY